jgi:hypothetical protein
MIPKMDNHKSRDSSEAEQGFRKAQVVGSSPTLGSKGSNNMDLKKKIFKKSQDRNKKER